MTTDLIEIEDAVEIEDALVYPLTIDEQQMLERCELIIGQGLQTYVEVGRALTTIREGKLYRQHYDTWEEYCVDRWGMSRSRAYQLMDASKVAADLSTMVDNPPTNEREAREVGKAAPADRPRVIERADQLAAGTKRTAKHIEQAREEIAAPDLPPEYDIIKRRLAAHGHILSEQIQGQHRVYSIKREGMTGIAVFDWSNVLDRLERMEANPPPPPIPDPAVEMEIKRLCAISGSKYIGTPTLPYPTATRYRIAKFSGGGGDYLADEALEQLRDECDKRSAAVQQQITAGTELPTPTRLPPVPPRPKRPVSADASAVIVYIKKMEIYASALEGVIMELQKMMA